MASLFKQKTIVYRLESKKGRKWKKDTPGAVKVTVTSKVWYGQYKDADGLTRRKPLSADKQRAREILNKLATDAKMQQVGLADPFTEHRNRPLVCPDCKSTGRKINRLPCDCSEDFHLTGYRGYLAAKGDTTEHVALTIRRIVYITEGIGAKLIEQISPSRVMDYLAMQRKEGMAVATSNHYLRAIKGFSTWLVKDRRTGQDVLKFLSSLNTDTDRRHRRRSITAHEFRILLDKTRASTKLFRGLTGSDRYMLYALAGYTGLRCSELASLTPECFNFEEGTVTVQAGYSKRRKEDTLPLHPELVNIFAEYLKGKTMCSVWPGTWSKQASAKMLRLDLKVAKIPYRDAAGRVFDFHAMRGQFISELARQGVHPRTAQILARHSSINLTMNTYTHLGLVDLKAAIEALPTPTGNRASGNCSDNTDNGESGKFGVDKAS